MKTSPRPWPLCSTKKVSWPRRLPNVGLSGADDPTVWTHAYHHDQVVITLNAGDFLNLAAGVEAHPGLLVLRVAGLSRSEQWAHLEPALEHCLAEEAAGRSLVNKAIEIYGVGPANLQVYDLPGG